MKGPEPIVSLIWVKPSMLASCSRITAAQARIGEDLEHRPELLLELQLEGELARRLERFPPLHQREPLGWRCDQRFTEATASLARTGEPSWNFMPERRVKLHLRPSSLFVQVSTICGCGRHLLVHAEEHVVDEERVVLADRRRRPLLSRIFRSACGIILTTVSAPAGDTARKAASAMGTRRRPIARWHGPISPLFATAAHAALRFLAPAILHV